MDTEVQSKDTLKTARELLGEQLLLSAGDTAEELTN